MNVTDLVRHARLVQVTRETLPEVHAMWLEAADWMKSQGINQWIASQLTLEAVDYCYSIGYMFIAKSDGESIGTFFLVKAEPDLWGDEGNQADCAYLHRLVVKRAYAGLGLGYRLLDLAAERLREQNLQVFRLDCMADSPKLNELYRKAGFTFRRRVDGDGWSANLYEKPLN
ncbi:GNAT family N-acetyltransferase [Cohnella endophytica]|uniref:GNAT family N-acetyltransferase n=1 Tax=Cohnella endophytica TaxID=2419778 RepID=A0A494XJL2_9BACL|nr:GNAT family N-acetyltransferase [Cohnella endophytica]RKP49952.1 GNAT family N-acetyltransferase [Cohnella endophytica]